MANKTLDICTYIYKNVCDSRQKKIATHPQLSPLFENNFKIKKKCIQCTNFAIGVSLGRPVITSLYYK